MTPLRRRLVRTAVVLGVLVGLVGGYYVGLYFYVDRSLDRVSALSPDAPEVLAPQLQEGAETYLVVGTGLPGESGPSSVTTLLAHVNPAGDGAVLVTVPPTALVDTPECRAADGSLRDPTSEPFAAALLQGGPSCLVRAVQQLSGLRVDHYLGLDLGALPSIVDALDGVSVCLPAALPVGTAGLDLPAGTTELSGGQATRLLTAGSGAPADMTGSEVVAREQLVLTAALREALDLGTLANPLRATSVLTSAADAFTVDEDTTIGDVRSFASTLRDLPDDAVQRASVPVARVGYVPAGSTVASVLLDGMATRDLFDSVITRGVLPDPDPDPGVAATVAGAGPAAPTGDAAPADPALPATVTVLPPGVTVDVLDATGATADPAAGAGAATGVALAAQGFVVRSVVVEPAAGGATVVRYGPDVLEQARTLATAVPGAVLEPSASVGNAVQLVVTTPDVAVQPVTVGTAVPESATPPPPSTDTATCG